jgi:phosphoenolpyruvate carboxykinase (ATP)
LLLRKFTATSLPAPFTSTLFSTRKMPTSPRTVLAAREKAECDPVFGLDVVTKCPNVPSEILIPRNVWSDKAAYEAAAKKLASLFAKNFATYEGGVSAEVKAAGPNV